MVSALIISNNWLKTTTDDLEICNVTEEITLNSTKWKDMIYFNSTLLGYKALMMMMYVFLLPITNTARNTIPLVLVQTAAFF